LGRVGGFSETWYIDKTFARSIQSARALAGARAALTGNRTLCLGSRITEIGGKTYTDNHITPGRVREDSDVPQMALLLKIGNDNLSSTKIFTCRGFLDTNVFEGDFTASRATLAAVQQMEGVLSTEAFRFRAKTNLASGVSVVSIDANGNFVLSGPLTFAVGGKLQVLRMRNTLGNTISGSFYVAARTSDTVGQLANWTGGAVAGSGKIRVLTYSYPLADGDLKILRVITRKVGRPFEQYRGRRSRVRA